MSEKPPWRVAIEQFERSIGAPIEEYIKTDEFADAAASAAKGQAEMHRKLESSTTQLLHGMNLPAASDIAELRAEIAELRKEVRELARALRPAAETAAAETARPKTTETETPKPKPKRAPAAAKTKAAPKRTAAATTKAKAKPKRAAPKRKPKPPATG